MKLEELEEQARMRVSTMLSLADALEARVGPDEIRRAALVSLTPVALGSAVVVANLILVLGEKLAFTLAGLADDNVLAKLLTAMDLGHRSYSMTCSARSRSDWGTVRPSALTVLTLTLSRSDSVCVMPTRLPSVSKNET